MNRPLDPDPRGLQDRGFHLVSPDPEASMGCETCREPLAEETRFSAYWGTVKRRVSFCRDCLGEVFFDVLPIVTGPTPDTPAGRGSPLGEPDPWQENAIRALEGTND